MYEACWCYFYINQTTPSFQDNIDLPQHGLIGTAIIEIRVTAM